ncbi:glycosyltransferase [Salinisphaera sp. SWV1]
MYGKSGDTLARLLFVTTNPYIPQMTGGSEYSTHDLCRNLASSGWAVGVLSSLGTSGRVHVLNRLKAKLLGVECPCDRDLGYPVYRGWDVAAGIPEAVRGFQPDLLVIQAGRQSHLARAIVEERLPFIWYLRDVEFDRQVEDVGGEAAFRSLLQQATVVANSAFSARLCQERFGVKSHTLPPLVDFTNYRCAGPLRRRVALFVNPVAVKGVETVFRLAERRPDIPFLMVESWPLSDERMAALRARAARLGNVEIRRRVSDMRDLYQEAKVGLMPSQCREAWGRVATELQVNGIPVLASDIGGLPESVGRGGVLVAPDASVDEWASALSEIWDDDDRYAAYVDAALEHARRPEIQVDNMIKVFMRIAEEAMSETV